MASVLNPYLHFNGTARQAMEFYRSVFGGDLALSTFGELGAAQDREKVMHAQLETTGGYTIMAADVPGDAEFRPPAGFAVSISGDDSALRGYFEKLSGGGTVEMPLAKQAWGDEFGMVTDQFGIAWAVNIGQPQQPS
jgi:PhnB protein